MHYGIAVRNGAYLVASLGSYRNPHKYRHRVYNLQKWETTERKPARHAAPYTASVVHTVPARVAIVAHTARSALSTSEQ